MNNDLINLNNELNNSSFFSDMFDKIKDFSVAKRKEFTIILASSILVAIISPIASNLYIEKTLKEGVFNNSNTKIERLKIASSNYIKAINDNYLFMTADKIGTTFNNLLSDNEGKTNSHLYFDEIKALTATYPNTIALEKKIGEANEMRERYLKNNKIEENSNEAIQVNQMFEKQFNSLLKEYEILKKVEIEITNKKEINNPIISLN